MMPYQEDQSSHGFTKISLTIFFVIVCLYIAGRIAHLTEYELWTDEVFSLNAALVTWNELISIVVKDFVHPPLFYLLLKIWINIGGESLLWLRLFPCLISIATIIPFFLLSRDLKLSAPEINTALTLLTVNSYLIHFAQDVRMYSLLLFLAVCSIWVFVRLISGKGRTGFFLALLFLINLILIYTHYFGWLVVGTECTYVLLFKRKHLLSFAIHIAVLALCFAPWAYTVINAVIENRGNTGDLGWLQRPQPYDLVAFYTALNGSIELAGTTRVSLIIFTCPLAFWVWRNLREGNGVWGKAFGVLVLFSFLPAIVTFISSQLLPTSVWGERHLIIVAVPYLTLVAVAIRQLPSRAIRVAFTLIALSWAVIAGTFAFFQQDKMIHWNTLTHALSQAETLQSEHIRIYSLEKWIVLPLRHSLGISGERRFEVAFVKNVKEIGDTHFWIAFRSNSWHEERLPQAILKDAGCLIGPELQIKDRNQTVIVFSSTCRQ